MQVTKEPLDPCQVALTIEVESDKVVVAVDRAYREYSKYVVVPGFRKGKAPMSFVKQRVPEADVRQRAAELLVEPAYAEAIKQAAENVGVLVRPAHPMPASAAVVGQHRLPLSVAQLTNVALPSSTADQMEAAEPGFVPPPIDQSGCGPSALFSRTRPVLASTPTSWVLPPLLMSKE